MYFFKSLLIRFGRRINHKCHWALFNQHLSWVLQSSNSSRTRLPFYCEYCCSARRNLVFSQRFTSLKKPTITSISFRAVFCSHLTDPILTSLHLAFSGTTVRFRKFWMFRIFVMHHLSVFSRKFSGGRQWKLCDISFAFSIFFPMHLLKKLFCHTLFIPPISATVKIDYPPLEDPPLLPSYQACFWAALCSFRFFSKITRTFLYWIHLPVENPPLRLFLDYPQLYNSPPLPSFIGKIGVPISIEKENNHSKGQGVPL